MLVKEIDNEKNKHLPDEKQFLYQNLSIQHQKENQTFYSPALTLYEC